MQSTTFSQLPLPNGITLCGCGWLGKHFARSLPQAKLLGTTRNEENFAALTGLGVSPIQFSLGDNPAPLAEASGSNAVILNIPPGRKAVTDVFITAMKSLITALLAQGACKLIFISTTSVFGDARGKLDYRSAVSPVTDSGKAHCELEKFLLALEDPRVYIVRLAGLVGRDRHPARFLAGKTLDKGEQAVNLVHIDDVVSALKALLPYQTTGVSTLMQLCALSHPRRDDYYRWAAKQLNLPEPIFSAAADIQLGGKQIASETCWKMLGLTPQYASPYDML